MEGAIARRAAGRTRSGATRLRRRVGALYSVTLSLGRNDESPDVDTLTELAGACRDHRLLELEYSDRGGRASSRTIEPLRLVNSGRRWYLLAWDRSREDWLRGHRDYFSAQARREGFAFDDGIAVVFERFRIVWPLRLADAAVD